MLFNYDNSNEKSIYEYAKKLEGKKFKDILNEYNNSLYKSYDDRVQHIASPFIIEENKSDYTTNPNAKGELGGFLEKHYFGYQPNSKQEADFEKIGIELKQTCIDTKKNGEYTAGERLVITNISYNEPVADDMYESHLWNKIKRMLLIHYLRDKSIDRFDYEIKFVNLFTPPTDDLKIIIEDYKLITQKLKDGKAHEISEGDTFYLGACTKGATAAKSMQPQYYGNHALAKKRAFCFKRSYMDYILNNYVLKNKVPYESILSNNNDEFTSFEQLITDKINQHIGKTDYELCQLFDRKYNNNKAQWSDLAYRMLGIKGNHAEEFVKANIIVKSIRIEEDGTINEHMSFPAFKFKELAQEEWEDSTIYEYFSQTKFLFVIYKSDGSSYRLLGSQFWHMPENDLDTTVKEEWAEIRDRIKNGVKFTVKKTRVANNLPKQKNSKILHIRPHAQKAAYKLHTGYVSGNVSGDANELPNGEWMTNQSFWINNSYILSQLKYK